MVYFKHMDNLNNTIVSTVSLDTSSVTPLTNEPTQSNVIPSTDQQSSYTNKTKWIPRMITGLLFILVIGVGVIFATKFIKSSVVIDQNNGFKFSDTRGWVKIPPREGANLSLATFREKQFIFSYAEVRALPNNMPDKFISRMLSEDNTLEITEMCKNTATDKKMEFLGIERVNIPSTNSYKCKFEGIGENTNGNIVVMETLFVTKPKINLLITTVYQKNLPEEKANVDRLMSGFQIIN